MSDALPELAVFTLGGTIASVPDSGGQRATPTLSAEDLLAAVPQLQAFARLQAHPFRQYPSGDLAIADLLELAHRITALTAEVRGFIVTQGTDTLEEGAYLLDLATNTHAPVVVTGAMRHPGLPGADGPANLLAAAQVAASEQARGLGTLVVFNDEVHAARFVRKTHTASTATFGSPSAGPLGWINEGRVRIPLIPRQRTPAVDVRSDVPIPQVALVRLGLGAEAKSLRHLPERGYAGAVIETYGGGHVPSHMLDTLATLVTQIPIVFASRTGAGELFTDTYGFPGSEQDLLSLGLISAGALDGLKARLLLAMLLASGADSDNIQHRFTDHLC